MEINKGYKDWYFTYCMPEEKSLLATMVEVSKEMGQVDWRRGLKYVLVDEEPTHRNYQARMNREREERLRLQAGEQNKFYDEYASACDAVLSADTIYVRE